MFGSMVRRLLRRPWSLALVGGLVVLLGAAFFVAGPARNSLFGLNVGGCEIKPNTQCANAFMIYADLSFAKLNVADLNGANLYRANLSWANLTGADLTWANLRVANLRGARLNGANLTSADLRGALLSEADLTGTQVASAEFDGAEFCKTTWVDGSTKTTPGYQC